MEGTINIFHATSVSSLLAYTAYAGSEEKLTNNHVMLLYILALIVLMYHLWLWYTKNFTK